MAEESGKRIQDFSDEARRVVANMLEESAVHVLQAAREGGDAAERWMEVGSILELLQAQASPDSPEGGGR